MKRTALSVVPFLKFSLHATKQGIKTIPWYTWCLFLTITFFCVWFLSQAFQVDEIGNVLAGHEVVWADGAAHLTMISAFGYRDLLIDSSPFVINTPFSYPFIINWISGLLVRTGWSVFDAFVVISGISILTALLSIYFFLHKISTKHSTATLALFLYLTNGGMGIYYFVKDVLRHPQPWFAALNPYRYYTHIPELKLDYINIFHSMLFPQRAFSLGLLAGSIAIYLFYQLLTKKNLTITQRLVFVLLIGTMPLVHTHTFLALFFTLGFWTLWYFGVTSYPRPFNKQNQQVLINMLYLGLPTGLLSLCLHSMFFASNVGESFIRWQPGWYATEQRVNWIVYWLMNWGISLPLWILSTIVLVAQEKKQLITGFVVACLATFLLSNLFIWQPNIFDNSKIFAWTTFGATLSISWLLTKLWRNQKNKLKYVLIPTIVILLSASGLLDVYRVARTDLHSFVMYSAEEMELVDWVKNNTEKDSIWLTSDRHNHWLWNLTGRQTLMAYRGWLWTYGYNYRRLETNIASMYKDPGNNLSVFEEYGVDYVVIGPHEKQEWGAKPELFIDQRVGSVIKQTSNYIVIKLHDTNQKPATTN